VTASLPGTTAGLGQGRTPERPGPGPTPEALLRALDLTVGRRIRGLIPGEYRAHDLGGGTELAQVRPYEPGDDVRRMDWNVTARTMVPHVRVHVPERALTAWLLLDVSPSMTFGTADRRKADVAEGVAVAIGHLATQRGNRLGVVTFGSSHDRRIPPAAGRIGLLAMLTATRIDAVEEGTGATTPADAIRIANAAAPRGGVVLLVSDFRGPRDWRRPLLALGGRHHVVALEIRDAREQELPRFGQLRLVDPETGRQLRVDTSNGRVRSRFAAAAAQERREVAAEITSAGARHVVLKTEGDWLRDLTGFLRHAGAQ